MGTLLSTFLIFNSAVNNNHQICNNTIYLKYKIVVFVIKIPSIIFPKVLIKSPPFQNTIPRYTPHTSSQYSKGTSGILIVFYIQKEPKTKNNLGDSYRKFNQVCLVNNKKHLISMKFLVLLFIFILLNQIDIQWRNYGNSIFLHCHDEDEIWCQVSEIVLLNF